MTITSQKTKSRHITVQGACPIPSSGSHVSWRFISLSQGQFAIVDADKYEWLMQWKWCIHESKFGYAYAVRGEKGKTISMHRQILNCKKCKGTVLLICESYSTKWETIVWAKPLWFRWTTKKMLS